MRGIALTIFAMVAGTGGAAAAQIDPATAELQSAVEGCAPARPGGGRIDGPSPAARTAMLSCLARESARVMSTQLPLQIDEITTLRSVAADGPELTYLNDVEVDAAGLTVAQNEALIETTRAFVCSQPVMRAAVSAGSSYRYIWFDRTGAEFNRMTIARCADEADEEAGDAPDEASATIDIASLRTVGAAG